MRVNIFSGQFRQLPDLEKKINDWLESYNVIIVKMVQSSSGSLTIMTFFYREVQ